MADFESFFENLRGKRAAVLGLGVSNTPLIQILQDYGVGITVCDKKGELSFSSPPPCIKDKEIEFHFGDDYLEGLDQDIIFRSPGIRPDHPALQKAVSNGSVLTSEMEVFMDVCPCRIIAVTGSDGKTTTSTLISKIIEESGRRCFLGGNIGTPLLARTKEIGKDDFAVLELSSFQLMTMKISPDVAVITNVAPNHLDWHTSMEEYKSAKENLICFQNEEDTAVLNADNAVTLDYASRAKGNVLLFSRNKSLSQGIFLQEDKIVLRQAGKTAEVVALRDILLPGVHNIENYMAAASACYAVFGESCFGAVQKVAKHFKGVEHRIELVREKDGVRFYNDSIASSPTRTIAGLRSFDQKVRLIAGGYDKHIPFDELGPEITKHVKAVYLTGPTAKKIRAAVENSPDYQTGTPEIFEFDRFADAVRAAARDAGSGDIVLMSPACASFDAFRNFAERGQAFRDIVNSL